MKLFTKGTLGDYLEKYPSLQALPFWLAAVVVGFFTVAYTRLFHWITLYTESLISQAPAVVFVLSPLCLVVAWWIVSRFAPAAAGSGIPQVQAAIEIEPEGENSKIKFLLGPKVVLVKMFSSLICIFGGGAIGPEGPTVQMSAGLFQWIGTRSRRLFPKIGSQSLIIAGGAAGIAAAFNTPLGGIVFAIEELSHQQFMRFRTVVLSAVIISGMVAQWLIGPFLFFGYPVLQPVGFGFFPWAIGVGVVCGAAGASFGSLIITAGKKLRSLSRYQHLIFVVWVGLAIATASYFIHPEIMGSGTHLVSNLLSHDDTNLPAGLVVGRFIGPILCSLTGTAAGLLAPALAAGGVIAGFLARILESGHDNLMILLGMIAFLSGMTRSPFTSFVLVLEMTDRHSAIFPMMAASIVATAIARLFDTKSFYEHLKEQYVESAKSMEPLMEKKVGNAEE